MNTTKIGDTFEDKSYELIEKAIYNDELGISKSFAKVFRKKGYYSNDREKEIIFDLSTVNGKKISGYFDVENSSIFIDKSILSTEKFPFVLGHELGHFFLHSELSVNQEKYNDFEDSEYDFFTDRHNLVNDRNWIEWQANKFSIALFLPKNLFITHLIAYRKSIGIIRPEHIYLDEQMINKQDYYKTLEYLSVYFGISKTSIKFRIEELNLITYIKPKDDMRSIIRRAFYD